MLKELPKEILEAAAGIVYGARRGRLVERPSAAHGSQRHQRDESRHERGAPVEHSGRLVGLDGWWEEGYNGKNGWAPNHREVDGNRDQADAAEIYRILEEDIIPMYYKSSEEGIPHEWARMMKEAIKSAAAQFSARRMVKEYVAKFNENALKNL